MLGQSNYLSTCNQMTHLHLYMNKGKCLKHTFVSVAYSGKKAGSCVHYYERLKSKILKNCSRMNISGIHLCPSSHKVAITTISRLVILHSSARITSKIAKAHSIFKTMVDPAIQYTNKNYIILSISQLRMRMINEKNNCNDIMSKPLATNLHKPSVRYVQLTKSGTIPPV